MIRTLAICAIAAAATAAGSTPAPAPELSLYPCAMLIQWNPADPRSPAIQAAGDRALCAPSHRMALLSAQLLVAGAAR